MLGFRPTGARSRVVGLPGLFLLVAALLTGCAGVKESLAPSAPSPAPPASAPPAKKPSASPPPVLSPQVGREDEERLRQDANTRIRKAELIVEQVDQKKLVKEQQDTFSTIQSFLTKAKEALSAQDFPRASNLADKAGVLAEELVRNLR